MFNKAFMRVSWSLPYFENFLTELNSISKSLELGIPFQDFKKHFSRSILYCYF